MAADRLRTVLLVEWLALSTLLLIAIAAPLFLPGEALAVLIPDCPERLATGQPCFTCATVTSLVLIAGGRLNAAMRESAVGLPLAAMLVWNECLALLYSAGELRWLWKQMRRPRQPIQTEEYSCRL